MLALVTTTRSDSQASTHCSLQSCQLRYGKRRHTGGQMLGFSKKVPLELPWLLWTTDRPRSNPLEPKRIRTSSSTFRTTLLTPYLHRWRLEWVTFSVSRDWGQVCRDWGQVGRDWGQVSRDWGQVCRDWGQVCRALARALRGNFNLKTERPTARTLPGNLNLKTLSEH